MGNVGFRCVYHPDSPSPQLPTDSPSTQLPGGHIPTSCGVNEYLASSTNRTCSPVSIGEYSASGSTRKYSCSNKPSSNARYTGKGTDGRDNCPFACRGGYTGSRCNIIGTKHWTKTAVYIDYNLNTCPASIRKRYKKALTEGMAIWNSIPKNSLRLFLGKPVSYTKDNFHLGHLEGSITAACDADAKYPMYAWTKAPTKQGTNEIWFGGIFMGPSSYEVSDKKFLAIMTHEIGHAIGLAHVSDRKAIMFTYVAGTQVIIPSTSDRANILFRYSPEQRVRTSRSLARSLGGPVIMVDAARASSTQQVSLPLTKTKNKGVYHCTHSH